MQLTFSSGFLNEWLGTVLQQQAYLDPRIAVAQYMQFEHLESLIVVLGLHLYRRNELLFTTAMINYYVRDLFGIMHSGSRLHCMQLKVYIWYSTVPWIFKVCRFMVQKHDSRRNRYGWKVMVLQPLITDLLQLTLFCPLLLSNRALGSPIFILLFSSVETNVAWPLWTTICSLKYL